jgi:hypothetical protein
MDLAIFQQHIAVRSHQDRCVEAALAKLARFIRFVRGPGKAQVETDAVVDGRLEQRRGLVRRHC